MRMRRALTKPLNPSQRPRSAVSIVPSPSSRSPSSSFLLSGECSTWEGMQSIVSGLPNPFPVLVVGLLLLKPKLVAVSLHLWLSPGSLLSAWIWNWPMNSTVLALRVAGHTLLIWMGLFPWVVSKWAKLLIYQAEYFTRTSYSDTKLLQFLMEAPLSFSRDLSANSLGSTQEWHVMHCMVSPPLNNMYLSSCSPCNLPSPVN